MQARRLLLTRMFAFADGCKHGGISLAGNETYSFQIPVDYAKVVHVLQPICNTGQLNDRISEASVGSSDNAQALRGLCAGISQ